MNHWIHDYVIKNKIEQFVCMAAQVEKNILKFFKEKFKDQSLNCQISIDKLEILDLWTYFILNPKYKVISFDLNNKQYLEKEIVKLSDPINNKKIGEQGRTFIKHICNNKSGDFPFSKVKKHNINDLKKGHKILNYLVKIASISDESTIDIESLFN